MLKAAEIVLFVVCMKTDEKDGVFAIFYYNNGRICGNMTKIQRNK